MTKIWLINCINEERKKAVETKYFGLGTAYVASYARKYGDFQEITITEADQHIGSETIKKNNPDIVGISSVTQNFNIAKLIAKAIKTELDIPVVMGGHHITALPSNLTEDMDFAIIGEGEQTFLDLLFAYESNGLDKSKLCEIDGIAYKQGPKLRITAPRKLIKPLDKIPFPARDLVQDIKNYYMFTSRGCPYSCVFCSSAAFWGEIRFFSAEYVLAEIKELVEKYNTRYISLFDDLFVANKKRVKKIVELIKREKLDQKVRFGCLARANLVDDELASLLKSMNVERVSMGLESGSEKVLRYLKGGSVTVEQNRNAVNILKKHKIDVTASFIIGSPMETKQDCMETLNFVKESKLDQGETYVLLPFPGTELWNHAKEKGQLDENMDWDNFEIYTDNKNCERITVSDKLSKDELMEILSLFEKEWDERSRRYLVHKSFSNPRNMAKLIYKKIKKVTE